MRELDWKCGVDKMEANRTGWIDKLLVSLTNMYVRCGPAPKP